MAGRLTSTQRALLTGVTAAGVLIGAFAAGAAQGGDPAAAATASGRTLAVQPGTAAGVPGPRRPSTRGRWAGRSGKW
jgi:hypothetical protein